jgi:hypothetical protein
MEEEGRRGGEGAPVPGILRATLGVAWAPDALLRMTPKGGKAEAGKAARGEGLQCRHHRSFCDAQRRFAGQSPGDVGSCASFGRLPSTSSGQAGQAG